MAATFALLKTVFLLQLGLLALSDAATTGHGRLHARHSVHKRAAAVSTNLPSGWSSQGCYTDSVASRALSAKTFYGQTVTELTCIDFCNTAGYAYAAVEYAQECYCGNVIAASGQVASDQSTCNMACAGDATQLCGGPDRINVFHNNNIKTPVAGPATNAGPPGWGFMGCYTDSVGARTLIQPEGVTAGSQGMTVALCTQACQLGGFNISGVEYSGECYCGNSFSNGGAPAPDGLTGCNMVCNGNSSEYCGGPNRLDVYGLGTKSIIEPAWAPLGCYTDSVGARSLTTAMAVLGGAANMTQENCQNACYTGGYNISGTEYSAECYCGTSFANGGGPAPDGTAGCNMGCNGASQEICGGSNRLTVFQYTGTLAATAPAPANPPPANPDPAPSTGSGQIATNLPGNFTYKGCYIDMANGRIVLNQQPDSQTLTVESCVQACIGLGYKVAALEYSYQCFCGNDVRNGGTLASSDTDCSNTCSGNSSETCGGPNRMSIYSSGNLSIYTPPAPVTTGIGDWSYFGCVGDSADVRTLPYMNQSSDPNFTIKQCLDLCSAYGYSAGGIEYGVQCFCGDDTDRVNAGATTSTNCNMACPGNPSALCGGGNALNYYTLNNKIDTWHQAYGNDAGEYRFLIGGVVIPLITAVGRNGKVQFTEKHGTGPPNSTGAYELDLALVDDISNAWRTMNGLQTDVFCSAGLMLPDKAGRQLNIGGWSADSLYGVRLYAPDGSPGQKSVNDWQENYQEIALQTGRWYPTAMVMVNGSILVVGGENGSNGPPVPNLEVVPKPAGGSLVYCDWLQQTDPYNLYPFLSILPNGGILALYYNQGRILDEKTFGTIRTLPQIPGAVNNPAAGRTYPLEGTAMIMPQSAPYTDPFTVVICGGSTPFGGVALDNCVSIQPEVPNANWTIERMPSKRVITCMTALPDGTYLIMNGAMQGVAGFGLASQPNHNALLYDPTKPVHQRITRLANTTIDRLYHSEAILLPDGRVLVSGSDPEGAPYVQEYRVEVFVPPYLMGFDLSASNLYGNGTGSYQSNATALAKALSTSSNSTSTNSTSNSTSSFYSGSDVRPIYTINNNKTDWVFGDTVTITILQGNAAKISMMGAVSSTHGNSMGQRTIFPAFSCSGRTCTITAPPNGHITGGPGWFMLFVLNSAGVPSFSQWIRIGGDPANLGNWPNYPDFSLPGV